MSKDIHKQKYGTSATYCDDTFRNQIAGIKPKQIVDFGAGSGKIGGICREVLGTGVRLIAVEGDKKTADMLSEKHAYDVVYHNLVQDWMDLDTDKYDTAVFGDVLEHLTPKEIRKVITKCFVKFNQIIIICPVYELFQDVHHDNVLEIHRTYMTPVFFDRYHPVEKHIVRGELWTIMNVLILSETEAEPWKRRVFWYLFDKSMYILQPTGLARPFVSLLKRTVFRDKNMHRIVRTKR